MAVKLRNVSEHALDLRPVGRTVEPDEVVEIDDETYASYVWPETLWAEVAVSTTKKDKE